MLFLFSFQGLLGPQRASKHLTSQADAEALVWMGQPRAITSRASSAKALVGQTNRMKQVDIPSPGVVPDFPFKSIWLTEQDGWQRGQRMPTRTLIFLLEWILKMSAWRRGMSSLLQQELLQVGLPAKACFACTWTVSSLDLKYFRKLSNKYFTLFKITTSLNRKIPSVIFGVWKKLQ